MIGTERRCRAANHCAVLASRLALSTAGLVPFLALAACSAGNGGPGGFGEGASLQANPRASFLEPTSEPTAPSAIANWSASQEYANSTGLAQLKAAEGYARRVGGRPSGEGVRIAIIDSGIDVTHPDLGNLHGTSWTAGGEALTADSHATFVAGIAAASRTQSADPNDMHGMAYRATLVNFQAARPSQTAANGFVSFSTNDLVDAIDAASGLSPNESAVESDILNLSLGAPASSDDAFARLRSAMRTAAGEDKIMVLAAGNEGLSSDPDIRLQPIYPAAYADDPEIAGLAIVVGNLTSSNGAAASSNLCGDARDYCLFAPGSNIRSTLNGGSYGIGSGTSFAAPYVSGAAAVVKAAFPGVSNRDVVDRLLLTAEDLGDPGVDSTFGRGRLDLEAAMAPVGPTGLPTGTSVDGPILPLEGTSLRLGRGLALPGPTAERLRHVMSVDSMGFPFPVDLGGAVSVTERDTGLSSFVSGDRRSAAAFGAGATQITAFVNEGDAQVDPAAPPPVSFRQRGETDKDDILPLRFSADLSERVGVFASLNDRGVAGLGIDGALAERGATSMLTGDIFVPHRSLSEATSGAGIRFAPTDGTAMAISVFTSLAARGTGEAALQQVELMQAMPGGLDLRLGLGLMQEQGGVLGSSARGAFGGDASSRSQFFSLSLLGPVAEDIDWFATYSRGRSSIDQRGDALLDNWSDTRSEAFGVGLIVHALATEDDGLTLMVGQPLRREGAEATVELPVARTPDGRIVTAKERLDFAPAAREIATEIGYRLPLGRGEAQDVRAAAYLRLNPDHDPGRDPDAGVGLAYRLRF